MSDNTAKSNEFTFIWKIENLQFCAKKTGEYLRSPIVTADTLDGSEWYLQIYPRGNVADSEEHVSLFLYRATSGKESQKKINMWYTLELTDEDGKVLTSFGEKNHAFDKSNGWGYTKFIETNLINNNNETLTISWSMVKSKAIIMPVSQCCVKSNIGVDQSSLEWIVKNFESPSWSESRHFFDDQDYEIEINLTAPEDDIKINIRKLDIKEPSCLTIKLSLLDSEGVEQLSKRMEHFFESCDSMEFPTFIKKSYLNANQNKYLKDNAFKLKCDFSFSNGKVVEEIEYYPYDSLSVLQNDLWNMYTSKKGTDITLKAQSDMFAHKSVLTARSSVFSAMFDTDMLENQTGIVEIPDIDAKILQSFLQFIYTGAVDELDEQTSQKLMVVADKYQVFSLKEICAFFLMSSLTVKNVCDILLLSDMVSHVKLKTSAVEYIKAHVDEVLSSEEWSLCINSNTKLATEVLCKLSLELKSKHTANTGTT